MANLRDLFVTLGVKYNDKGAKKAKGGLSGVKVVAEEAGKAVGRLKQSLSGLGAKLKRSLPKPGRGLESSGGAGGQVEKTSKSLSGMGKVVAGLGVGLGLHQLASGVRNLLSAASVAEETENVLDAVFKSGSKSVKDFARTAGAEIGRSQFQLREYAGIIGALVSPQLQGMGAAGQKAAADISKDFSTLAIDLASFFNTSEEDALMALRSGVSGETEPLKRFGINLTEEGMANALGVSKKQIASMTVAEKTLARYQAIMKLTVNAQGDAAKTADGYANTVRALESAWLDFRTLIGKFVLPLGTALARWAKGMIQSMSNLVRDTDMLKRVFTLLGVAIGAIVAAYAVYRAAAIAAAIQSALAWLAAAAPFILIAALIGAAILIIEDIWTALEGGDSVIELLVDDILGWKGAWDDLVNSMFDVSFVDAWLEGISEIWDKLTGLVRGPIDAVKDFFGMSGSSASVPRTSSVAGSSVPAGRASAAAASATAPIFNLQITAPSGNARDIGKESERAMRRALDEDRRRTRQAVQ